MNLLKLSLLSFTLAALMVGCSKDNNDEDPLVPEIESITIEGTNAIHSIAISSDELQLNGRINYTDGTSSTTYNELDWDSNTSDLNVHNGLLEANANSGDALISISYRDKIFSQSSHLVNIIALNDVNISSVELNITSGTTDINTTGDYNLVANGTFTDNNATSNISSHIIWTSSNATVANISSLGVLSVQQNGTADINISVYNDINSSLTINVGL